MAARLLQRGSLLRSLTAAQGYKKGTPSSLIRVHNYAAKGKMKTKADGSETGEENLSAKEIAVQRVVEQIQDDFGKGVIMWLGRSTGHQDVPVVSTGSFSLDLALGVGGLPKGRVVEIYGPEASGKTTLALHVIAEAQKSGGYCAFVGAEHALNPTLAEAIGVKSENLLLSQPDTGEQALGLVDLLIRSGSVDVVVVDSVAALVPKNELDGEMGDLLALQARLMSEALRKICHSLSRTQTILIFINQVGGFTGFDGPTEVPSGGNALNFYASVRLNIRRIGSVKKEEEVIGNIVTVKIVKNKHAPPFKMAQFELIFGKGISIESELFDLGLQYKFISKAGDAYYSFNGEKFCGKEKIKHYLVENVAAREELMANLREILLNPEAQKKDDEDSGTSEEEEIVTSEAAEEEVVA